MSTFVMLEYDHLGTVVGTHSLQTGSVTQAVEMAQVLMARNPQAARYQLWRADPDEHGRRTPRRVLSMPVHQ